MTNIKKQLFTTGILVLFIASATGCGKSTEAKVRVSDNPNQMQTFQHATSTPDTLAINAPTEEPNQTKTKTFSELLKETDNIEDLYDYIENNMPNATTDEWDEWINGLSEFGEGNADYHRLYQYRDNMSDEMKSFVELMAAEQQRPSFNEQGVQLTLAEILERCVAMEKHMDSYETRNTYNILYPKYCQLMNTAITGGYDSIDKTTNEYLDNDRKHIRTDAINEYKMVIKDHPKSKTADILEDYVDVLEENNRVANKKVEAFYDNLYKEIDEEYSHASNVKRG